MTSFALAELFRRHRQRFMVVASLVVPFAVALVLVPSRGSFTNTAAALVLVAFVVAISIAGSRFTGVVASLSSALWFDFFLTSPYERFAISHRTDLETTISIFVVGVMISELAARSRHHARVSNDESSYANMMSSLTGLAATPAPTSAIVEEASSSLVELLHLRGCRFERIVANPPLARILANGVVEHVGLHWPVSEIGIPGPEAEIVAEWRGRALGRFVVTPTPGEPVSRERRIIAVALANVVGATLDDARRAMQ
jgi:hypothetical protein